MAYLGFVERKFYEMDEVTIHILYKTYEVLKPTQFYFKKKALFLKSNLKNRVFLVSYMEYYPH